jgi:hypothetical protein
MKIASIITKSALVLAACASLNAQAGTPAPSGKGGKAVVPPVEEPGALFDTVGATLEVGYDTRYYFRGLWFADNTVWTGLNLSLPLTEKLSLGVGALYTNTVETNVNATTPLGSGQFGLNYQELDLFTSLNYDAGFAKFGLVYTHYNFFDGFSGALGRSSIPAVSNSTAFGAGETNITSTNEVGLTVASTLGPVNIYGGYYYDLNIGGSYAEVGADYPIEVTSWLSLVPAFKLGYGLDYYSFGGGNGENGSFGGRTSGLTHFLPSLSAPIKLTKYATLTPYLAYNVSLSARHANNTQDSEMFGGVKLGVSF